MVVVMRPQQTSGRHQSGEASATDPPRGEIEVREALLVAAAKLFAEEDPGAVSLRRIADQAGVNYGLVHRHLGTKVDVVAATVRRHSEGFVASSDAADDPIVRLVEMANHYLDGPAVARTLAWAALAGADPQRLVDGLGDVAELVAQFEARAEDPALARTFFAFAASTVLGVGVFGEVGVVAAGGSPDEVPELIDHTAAWLAQLAAQLGFDVGDGPNC